MIRGKCTQTHFGCNDERECEINLQAKLIVILISIRVHHHLQQQKASAIITYSQNRADGELN